MFSNSTSDNPVLQNTKLDKPEQRHSVLHDGIVIEGDWQSDGSWTADIWTRIGAKIGTNSEMMIVGPWTGEPPYHTPLWAVWFFPYHR